MTYLWWFLSIVIILSLVWRLLSRWVLIPWPSFLAFWLENPYMKIFAHEKTVVASMDVAAGSTVLEIGCGAGRVTQWLCKSVGESGSVLGIDLQKSMIKKAEKKLLDTGLENHKLKSGNFLEMDFGATKFDQVVMVTVLGEIPDNHKVLAKIQSMLKKEGRLSICEVIPDPCYISSKSLEQKCVQSNFVLNKIEKRLLCYVANFVKS